MTSVIKQSTRAFLWLPLCQSASVLAQPAHHAHHAQATTKPPALVAQPFNESSWSKLIKSGPKPMAYLFTTSYCSTCPEAFAVLHEAVKQREPKIPLAAVMMDVSGQQALRHASHFVGLTQLYAFDGFEPAIRQSVDPQWPNVTPYIVLIDRHGKMQTTLGPPSQSMHKRWLL